MHSIHMMLVAFAHATFCVLYKHAEISFTRRHPGINRPSAVLPRQYGPLAKALTLARNSAQEAIRRHKRFRLALAGGNTPRALLGMLADRCQSVSLACPLWQQTLSGWLPTIRNAILGWRPMSG